MKIKSFIPQKAINYLKHLPLAVAAFLYYRFPSSNLKVIGVTGTDGKTTTVNLIYQILQEADLPVAMVSTVSAKIKDKEIDTGFHVTAPEPWLLQKLLRQMVDQGIRYVVLEVTSHGLDQFRVWGINFEIGVLTNVTHEHLDYHRTYENYVRAKAMLFSKSKIAIINVDDMSFPLLSSLLKKKKLKVLTYGMKKEADFTPKKFPFKTVLPGEYNRYNCLVAIAVASLMQIPAEKIRRAVALFPGVTGRMEKIDQGQDFAVIIDFAHTPNGLEQTLKTLQERKKGRLIVVFGCAGLRDREKRPLMGEIAGGLADIIVLTAEDPRTEDPKDICEEIAFGCRKAGAKLGVTNSAAATKRMDTNLGKNEVYYFIEVDRRKAINFALQKLAKKDDIVVVCGKGHEKSMCYGLKESPWSEHEEVRKALLKVSPVPRVSKVPRLRKETK